MSSSIARLSAIVLATSLTFPVKCDTTKLSSIDLATALALDNNSVIPTSSLTYEFLPLDVHVRDDWKASQLKYLLFHLLILSLTVIYQVYL